MSKDYISHFTLQHYLCKKSVSATRLGCGAYWGGGEGGGLSIKIFAFKCDLYSRATLFK